MRYNKEQIKYYRSPRISLWKIKENKMATPHSKRIPLEKAIKTALFWDIPQTLEEIKKNAADSNLILDRIYSRSQTVDWVIELLSIEGLKKTYKRENTRPDLADEIEAFYIN